MIVAAGCRYFALIGSLGALVTIDLLRPYLHHAIVPVVATGYLPSVMGGAAEWIRSPATPAAPLQKVEPKVGSPEDRRTDQKKLGSWLRVSARRRHNCCPFA